MALPETIRNLLENGVHFGHLSKHWNPKMQKFIFGKKKNIYIIDLEKTAQKLDEAKDVAKEIAAKNGKILFIATKKQLKEVIERMAVQCVMPYVVLQQPVHIRRRNVIHHIAPVSLHLKGIEKVLSGRFLVYYLHKP